MRPEQRRAARRQRVPQSNRLGQMIGKIGRQPLQRVEYDLALNLRRDAPGLLVDRYDSAGVDRLAILFIEDFVLRVGELQAAVASHLDRAEQHDVLSAREDVSEKRLIEPR